MRLVLSPWRFLVRLLLFFGVTFALWQPLAPAYTQLLLNASRLGIWLTEWTGGPQWQASTTLMSRGTAIFFTNRNFATFQPPIDPQGIPAEWVMANLLLLLPLMLATPAPTWKVRVGRLCLAMVIALILQVADILVGIKFFYANLFRGVWSPTARQIYQFLDAFFQSWDTQLFPFAVWAGIHFRDLLALSQSAAPAGTPAAARRTPATTQRATRRRRKRGKRTTIVGVVVAILSVSAARAFEIDESKVVDLSYGFGAETVYWPTARAFELEPVAHGRTDAGYWYAANNFCAAEHGGTHMDAPIHFAEGKATNDQVPVTAGIGPLVRVDVSAKASLDPDYRLTVADLRSWEAAHGRIPRGAIVVMYSGWGKRWPDRKRFLGSDIPGDTLNLHFPGFSKEAAVFLVGEREIDAIGVDSPSIDHGPSTDFVVHQIIGAANKPGFESLAHLELVPDSGATLIALPIKIVGGSGGPLRAIAVLP